MQVNILEAKSRLSQLIKQAQAGEEVIIANRGEPVARLLPTSAPGSHERGKKRPRNFLQWLADNPLPAYAQRSSEEIEATIGEARDAWE
jgi:prevent-host-death family protein